MNGPSDAWAANAAHQSPRQDRFVLRLYVTGMTPRSLKAIANLTEICNQYLIDRHDVDIIDIYQHPAMAKADQIIASPTLVKIQPIPLLRIVGDLSDRQRVLRALDLANLS